MENGLEKQATSPQSPNWLLIMAVVLITGLITGGGVFVWQNSKLQAVRKEGQQKIESLKQQIQTLNQEIERLRDSETKEEKSKIPKDWKTYQNEEYGFEVRMPTSATVDDKYNRLVIFNKEKEEYFEVRLKEADTLSLDNYHYLDLPISSRSILGGKEALVFKTTSGYCDRPSCGFPFVAYSTKYNGDFYNLIFSGDTKLSETERSILDSFEFIRKDVQQKQVKLLGVKSSRLVNTVFEPTNGHWELIKSPKEFERKGYSQDQIHWIDSSLIRVKKGKILGRSFPEYKISPPLLDASDWVKYTNEQFGFSFKHPLDWSCNSRELFVSCHKLSPEVGVTTSFDINIEKETKPDFQLPNIEKVAFLKFDGKKIKIYSVLTIMAGNNNRRFQRTFHVHFPLGSTNYFVDLGFDVRNDNKEAQYRFFNTLFSTFSSLCTGQFSSRAECLE